MQLSSRLANNRPQPSIATPMVGRAMGDWQRLLSRFAPIGLGQMDAVALQNRTDTKYLLSGAQLARALSALAGQYRALEIGGVRLSAYETLYFDTPDFALYLQHHAG